MICGEKQGGYRVNENAISTWADRARPISYKLLLVRSFTLIELLAVIAVIALLASMLLPALKNVKDRSQSINCVSNLRQIGLKVECYLSDNANWYPAASSFTKPWVLLFRDSSAYEKKMLLCPGGGDIQSPCFVYMGGVNKLGYVFNRRLGGKIDGVSTDVGPVLGIKLLMPTNDIVACDAVWQSDAINPYFSIGAYINNCYGSLGMGSSDNLYSPLRHHGIYNNLFADIHVESFGRNNYNTRRNPCDKTSSGFSINP